MASAESLLYGPYDFNARDTQTNVVANATQAAPQVDQSHYVDGLTISASAAPAASVAVQLIEDIAGAATVRWEAQIPAAAFLPIDIDFKKAFVIAKGKSVTLQLPALGAGVTAKVAVRGITRFSSQ